MKQHTLSIHTTFIPRENLIFLDEWLQYHVHIGVEHFYLYDNTGSVVTRSWTQKKGVNKYGFNYQKLIKNLTDEEVRSAVESIINSPNLAGKCTLIPWQPRDEQGNIVYNQRESIKHCVQNYAQTSEWMCFIDIDEFLFSPSNRHLHELLDEFKKNEVSCAVITQKKFADRFLNLDKFVIDIYDCINNLDTTRWAPKNIIISDDIDIDNIKGIHDIRIIQKKKEIIEQDILRFNHYNVNPTQLKWMENFYKVKEFKLSDRDTGMRKYQDYIYTHCTKDMSYYGVKKQKNVEFEKMEIGHKKPSSFRKLMLYSVLKFLRKLSPKRLIDR